MRADLEEKILAEQRARLQREEELARMEQEEEELIQKLKNTQLHQEAGAPPSLIPIALQDLEQALTSQGAASPPKPAAIAKDHSAAQPTSGSKSKAKKKPTPKPTPKPPTSSGKKPSKAAVKKEPDTNPSPGP